MGNMKVDIYQNDMCEKSGGVILKFTNSRGNSAATWFSNPPNSIDHVSEDYLQDRLRWVTIRKVQADFIKKEFKEKIKPFYKPEEK